MTCVKCHERTATVHVTHVLRHGGGTETSEKIDLCPACAELAGLGKTDLGRIAENAIAGKKCKFCGQDAISGVSSETGESTYWCRDCGLERSRLLGEILAPELTKIRQQIDAGGSFLSKESMMSRMFDPEWKARAQAASNEATRLLKERRRQDGRDVDPAGA